MAPMALEETIRAFRMIYGAILDERTFDITGVNGCILMNYSFLSL